MYLTELLAYSPKANAFLIENNDGQAIIYLRSSGAISMPGEISQIAKIEESWGFYEGDSEALIAEAEEAYQRALEYLGRDRL